ALRLTIRLDAVRQQLVNAPTSAKALMILATDDDVRHRFQFTARSPEEERRERDRIKDLLALLINRARLEGNGGGSSRRAAADAADAARRGDAPPPQQPAA